MKCSPGLFSSLSLFEQVLKPILNIVLVPKAAHMGGSVKAKQVRDNCVKAFIFYTSLVEEVDKE